MAFNFNINCHNRISRNVDNLFMTPISEHLHSIKLIMKKVKAIRFAVQVVLFVIFFIQMQNAVLKYLGKDLYNALTKTQILKKI